MIPIGDDKEKLKQTNEIKIAKPLLDAIVIEGKNITADALLTQRNFAHYVVNDRKAHYFLTIKGNQPNLKEDITFYFDNINRLADHTVREHGHGRYEVRSIWVTQDLKDYLDFPFVEQVFKIERRITNKKTGKQTIETVYGITSRSEDEADASEILKVVRGHWSIENSCHYILDWNYDEDRCRIRKGNGPEVISRIRRFAVGLIKSKNVRNVAQKMRELNRNTRSVFDYLRMTKNSRVARNCAC